jgi:hypothetical protein
LFSIASWRVTNQAPISGARVENHPSVPRRRSTSDRPSNETPGNRAAVQVMPAQQSVNEVKFSSFSYHDTPDPVFEETLLPGALTLLR